MRRAFLLHWFTTRIKEETGAQQEGGCFPPEAPNGRKKAQWCYTGATNTLDRLRVALDREFAVRSVANRCNCCDEASGGHALPGGLHGVLFCATTTNSIKATRDGAQIVESANPTGMMSDPSITRMRKIRIDCICNVSVILKQ